MSTGEEITGTYNSGSEVAMPFQMEDLGNGTAMIQLGGYSGTIAKLKLRTTLPGRMFFVTTDEFLNFRTTVVNEGRQWYVQNQAKEYTTIPGTWNSATPGGKRRRKSRKTRRSRKMRRTRRR